MKKSALFGSIFWMSCMAHADNAPHWTYAGAVGAANWANLSPDFSACAGKNQSPINLTGFIEADLTTISFSYQPGGQEILNNGHTVQINYAEGSSITIDGTQFNLKQFHFHAPSENQINGKSYPMEAHLVHADKDGNLAVVGVMIEEGTEIKALTDAWAKIPKTAGAPVALPSRVMAEGLLPENRDYYRFNGSLTTPPCSEGVRWLVMKNTITASKAQIDTFKQALHEPNNRPLQPVNARSIAIDPRASSL